MLFTVEVVTAAVTDGDWSCLRRLLDVVPGTLLLEDPDEPTLIFPVDAVSPSRAFLFVEGVTKLADVTVLSSRIYPTPGAEDLGVGLEHAPPTPVEARVRGWLDTIPVLEGTLKDDGLVGA